MFHEVIPTCSWFVSFATSVPWWLSESCKSHVEMKKMYRFWSESHPRLSKEPSCGVSPPLAVGLINPNWLFLNPSTFHPSIQMFLWGLVEFTDPLLTSHGLIFPTLERTQGLGIMLPGQLCLWLLQFLLLGKKYHTGREMLCFAFPLFYFEEAGYFFWTNRSRTRTVF